MNVAIKAQQYQLALDIFAEMQAAGCQVRAGCALCFLFSSAVGVLLKSQYQPALDIVAELQAAGCQARAIALLFPLLSICCELLSLSGGQQGCSKWHTSLLPAVLGLVSKPYAIYPTLSWHTCRSTYCPSPPLFLQPNLVTFNTLIDVYGKLNRWTEAVRVVNTMRALVSAVMAELAAGEPDVCWPRAGLCFPLDALTRLVRSCCCNSDGRARPCCMHCCSRGDS